MNTHTLTRLAVGVVAATTVGTVGTTGIGAQAQPLAASAAHAVTAATTTTAAARNTHIAATRRGKAPARTAHKVVYLTFDDGPDRRYTPQVLALLKKHDAKATFFMIGSQAKADRALMKRVRAQGHAIGNHTYSHPWLHRLSAGSVSAQLSRTDAVLGRTTCMRPPGGFVNNSVRSVARRQGKRVVMWHVDPADWRRPGAATISRKVLKGTRNGSVVLLHDGGGNRSQTVSALSTILPRLAAQGYRFETLPACRR